MPSIKQKDLDYEYHANLDGVDYFRGSDAVAFDGFFELAGHKVHVRMPVPWGVMERLATVVQDKRIDDHGHAVWHALHPDRERPCASCNDEEKRRWWARANAIDVEAAPAKLPPGKQGESWTCLDCGSENDGATGRCPVCTAKPYPDAPRQVGAKHD